jgi:hypothetical protein
VDSLAFGEIAFVHYGKTETKLWRVSSVVLESVFIGYGYGYVEVEGIPTEGLGGKRSLIGALVPKALENLRTSVRPERPGCELSNRSTNLTISQVGKRYG